MQEMNAPTEGDVDPSLRLLQARCDKSQAAIDESIAAPDVKSWINGHVDTKRIVNPAADVGVVQLAVERVTCLSFASFFNLSVSSFILCCFDFFSDFLLFSNPQ